MQQFYLNRVVTDNWLLASLPVEHRSFLAAALKTERPAQGSVLIRRTEPGTEVWFPATGVVALSATDNEGRTVQTGIIGPEGCAGLESLFAGTLALADAIVQVPGEMSVISASHLRAAFDLRPAIQTVLFRFLCELTAQSLQTVACNRLHPLDARCCRWLLMMRDRTGDDDLPLTQENLATILGSGRPRINSLLQVLEQHGLLRRYRRRIRLLSRPALEHRACECYHSIHNMQNVKKN